MVNIIRRFLALNRLVRELVEVDLAFLGVLAQPMGVSCLEIQGLCSKIVQNGRPAKPLRPLLPPRVAGARPPCSFEVLRDLVEGQEWIDILSLFEEDLCGDKVVSVRVGGYFYHIPDLLSELERGHTLDSLKELIREYYREQAPQAIRALERLVLAVQYVRARLLEVQREIPASTGCTGLQGGAGYGLECVEG